MKKFFVILSGIYLIGLGVLAILFLGLGMFAAQGKTGQIQSANILFGIIFNLILLFSLVVTGIGIILRKNWARYVLFVLSGIAIFIGIILCLITVAFMARPATTPKDAQNMQSFIIFQLIFSSIFLFAIPIFFFVFFNRNSIKELFISKERTISVYNKRPLGVTLIAVLMLVGVVPLLLQAFFPILNKVPVVAGIFISGLALRAYYLIFAVINLYIALGFFSLKKSAWIAYVTVFTYSIIIGVINFFTFTEATITELMPQMAKNNYGMSAGMFKISIALSLLFNSGLLIYIYRKKQLFFENK